MRCWLLVFAAIGCGEDGSPGTHRIAPSSLRYKAEANANHRLTPPPQSENATARVICGAALMSGSHPEKLAQEAALGRISGGREACKFLQNGKEDGVYLFARVLLEYPTSGAEACNRNQFAVLYLSWTRSR